MRHIMQPNRWSCSIASAAMVMNTTCDKLIELIGHDGSEEVFPELMPPMRYKGFDIQEIVDAAFRLGYSMTPVETMPRCTPDGVNLRDVFPESKIKSRVDWYLDRYNAIAYGQRYGGNNWHVIAWSKDERRWHDPSGPVLSKDNPSIAIATLWIVVKNETYFASHMIDQLLSKNS